MKNLTILAASCALIGQSGIALAKPRDGMIASIVLDDQDVCKDGSGKEFFGAILAAALPSIVQAGVKGIGTALVKAGEPDETTIAAAKAGYFYSLAKNGNGNGLTIACLSFVVSHPGTAPATQSISDPGTKFIARQDKLKDRAMAFLYAAKVEIAKDGSAWRLVPTLAYVGQSLAAGASQSSNGKSNRDLVLTFSMQGASQNETDNVLTARSINFPRVTSNKLVSDVAGYSTGWIPFPAVDEAQAAAFAEARARKIEEAALEANKALTPAQTKRKSELANLIAADAARFASLLPVTFKFSLHETRDGNKFLQKAGEFIAGQSAAIAEPISNALIPDKRRAAEVAALTEATNLRVEAITAVSA